MADTLETGCDLLDVTSLHRPDTAWRFVDAHGHDHRWYVDGGGPGGEHISASGYSPQLRYITPTLIWVKDGEEYWEDDAEPDAVGHLECAQCGERIAPAYCADTTRQFIAGLRWFRINGRLVSREEFEAHK